MHVVSRAISVLSTATTAHHHTAKPTQATPAQRPSRKGADRMPHSISMPAADSHEERHPVSMWRCFLRRGALVNLYLTREDR